ncbi:MAG: hypothetical protein WCR27_06005, partial [Eubacteriales bacterium]
KAIELESFPNNTSDIDDTFPFEFICENLTKDIDLCIINICFFSETEINYIDKYFVHICEGDSSDSIDIVKKRVACLYRKKKTAWRNGATAEFFVHLYLNALGLKQECLFLNLEEQSIKKGFDGVYFYDNNPWIMESKSGDAITLEGNKKEHIEKIKEAIKDLNDKFSGNTKNDPWRNAYNHATLMAVNAPKNLQNYLKKLSNDFIFEKYNNIGGFKIIPSATIYLETNERNQAEEEIETDMRSYANSCHTLKAHFVCITQKTVKNFLDYIGLQDE